MKIKKFLILFAMLMLSAISVFAQTTYSTPAYVVADRKYGVLYGKYMNIVGYTNSIGSQTILGDPEYTDYPVVNISALEIKIMNGAFETCSQLTEVTIGECIIAIGDYAFQRCDNLTKVSISKTVTTIGEGAFYKCSSLTELTIPEGVTTIGKEAFRGCSSLTELTIPEGVTSIGKGAFRGCSSLTELTIPEGVTTIGEDAFRGCTNLTNVSIPESVTSIGADAFKGTKISGISHKETNNSVTVSDIPDQTYTGAAIEPEITVLDNETALALGTDYTIRYIGNIESGNATVIITGIGDYEGMEIKSFDIKSKALVASNVSDIPAQSFTGSPLKPSVTVKDGNKVLELKTDYTVSYTNNTNVGTATATISGKGNYTGKVEKTFTIAQKVTESGALTLSEDENGITAEINGSYTDNETFSLAEDISVKSITFDRTFQQDVTSTIILPFAIKSGKYSGGTFYEFQSVDYEDNKWVASMTKVSGDIEAQKPYLFVPSSDKLTIDGGVTLKACSGAEYADTKGDWTFKGVFNVKSWSKGVKTDYFFASTAATSTNGQSVNAGDFVRIGNNCGLNPFRCYLSYSGSESSLSKSEQQLPSNIEVRLIDNVASVVETDENPSDDRGDITTPVSEIIPNSSTKVWSFDKMIFIESESGFGYQIVDLSGRILKTGVTNSTREEISLGRTVGIVIVKIGGKAFKVNY